MATSTFADVLHREMDPLKARFPELAMALARPMPLWGDGSLWKKTAR
jgi:hypothetical protein